MVKKIILTEKEKDYIREHYSKGELSISRIAKNLQLDRGLVMRNAKEMGYVIFYIEEEGFSSKKDHIKKELLGLLQQQCCTKN